MSNITDGHLKSSATQRRSDSEVIADFRKVHGDSYCYSKMQYINNKTKIEILCKEHGNFWQAPGDHKRGSRCPICARNTMACDKLKPVVEVLQDFVDVHGDLYDYSSVKYIGAWNVIDIVCPAHGVFKQTPEHHRRGSGCPSCTGIGFNPFNPAILYYVRVCRGADTPLYKIGITNRTIKERFGADFHLITVLKTWEYTLGADAYSAEQGIIDYGANYLYKGPKILKCGNTELFTIDIGEYDV